MTEPLVTRADLEAFYDASLVLQVFSTDGGRTVAEDKLLMILRASAGEGEAILRRGWPSRTAVERLVGEDHGARKAFVDLAMAGGMGSKPEWTGQDAPFHSLRKDARKVLEDFADGATRSPGEDVAGVNTNRSPRVNARSFLFSPAAGCTRRPGGF